MKSRKTALCLAAFLVSLLVPVGEAGLAAPAAQKAPQTEAPKQEPAFWDTIDDVAAEQAKEKEELRKMKGELDDINQEIDSARDAMRNLNLNGGPNQPTGRQALPVQEIHLFARNQQVEVAPGIKSLALTYNNKIPGPTLHVMEGQPVKIVLHNESNLPTSLHLHGLQAPHAVDGLPRSGSADRQAERLLKPQDNFVYQFIAKEPGTYLYHPQVIHYDQRDRGLFGALIVHSRLQANDVKNEHELFIARLECQDAGKTKTTSVLTVNGKTAQGIPAIQVRSGERVRLRVFNMSEEDVPLHLSGHKLEVKGQSGADVMEPKLMRDTVTIPAKQRAEIEFVANNPGVWSLASENWSQISSNGKFPGGVAIVVRYKEY